MTAEVLPHFVEAVLAGHQRTYGYYAQKIGRDPATESIAIGPVMHLIGAICVFRRIPIAPLYYVTRADGEPRNIFAADPLESRYVLPHFDTLYIAAREYKYGSVEFQVGCRA